MSSSGQTRGSRSRSGQEASRLDGTVRAQSGSQAEALRGGPRSCGPETCKVLPGSLISRFLPNCVVANRSTQEFSGSGETGSGVLGNQNLSQQTSRMASERVSRMASDRVSRLVSERVSRLASNRTGSRLETMNTFGRGFSSPLMADGTERGYCFNLCKGGNNLGLPTMPEIQENSADSKLTPLIPSSFQMVIKDGVQRLPRSTGYEIMAIEMPGSPKDRIENLAVQPFRSTSRRGREAQRKKDEIYQTLQEIRDNPAEFDDDEAARICEALKRHHVEDEAEVAWYERLPLVSCLLAEKKSTLEAIRAYRGFTRRLRLQQYMLQEYERSMEDMRVAMERTETAVEEQEKEFHRAAKTLHDYLLTSTTRNDVLSKQLTQAQHILASVLNALAAITTACERTELSPEDVGHAIRTVNSNVAQYLELLRSTKIDCNSQPWEHLLMDTNTPSLSRASSVEAVRDGIQTVDKEGVRQRGRPGDRGAARSGSGTGSRVGSRVGSRSGSRVTSRVGLGVGSGAGSRPGSRSTSRVGSRVDSGIGSGNASRASSRTGARSSPRAARTLRGAESGVSD